MKLVILRFQVKLVKIIFQDVLWVLVLMILILIWQSQQVNYRSSWHRRKLEAPQEQKLEPVIRLCQVKTTRKNRMIDKEDTCSVEERAVATSYKGNEWYKIDRVTSNVAKERFYHSLHKENICRFSTAFKTVYNISFLMFWCVFYSRTRIRAIFSFSTEPFSPASFYDSEESSPFTSLPLPESFPFSLRLGLFFAV